MCANADNNSLMSYVLPNKEFGISYIERIDIPRNNKFGDNFLSSSLAMPAYSFLLSLLRGMSLEESEGSETGVLDLALLPIEPKLSSLFYVIFKTSI